MNQAALGRIGSIRTARRIPPGWRAAWAPISQCVDVYSYAGAPKIGIARIAETARKLGLGSRLGIDLPGEASGLIPTADWKLAVWGTPWHQGETVNAGIGQG